MQVSNPNDIKIYNLTASKSLPDWISKKAARKRLKHDPELQKRITLMQDFEMPTVSNCVDVTPDNKYIFVSGVYKPRVRVYDTSHMSLKFERCVDSEILKFNILSEDYSKFVMMMTDRYIEYHTKQGRWYRMRIPMFGRDMAHHKSSSDLYFVGVSSNVYRFNLELGRFLAPLKTEATEINCCQFSKTLELFTCGTKDGIVEYWDTRAPKKTGFIDCAMADPLQNVQASVVPGVTSLKYKNSLNLAVGTSTGQILLYDIRSDKPLLVKDHNYELPIKSIAFHDDLDLVLSIDPKVLKIWHRESGKPFTAIEPADTLLNDLCLVPNSGMLFMANEAPKVHAYLIPALGPAPKWSAALDGLVEEMEEDPTPSVYDDYKFVTRSELDSLGLQHLIGTNLLRGYMHGYFIDMRLYKKAKQLADPFAHEDYQKSKIREKIEDERQDRVRVHKLPKVNKELAQRLLINEETRAASTAINKKRKQAAQLLGDERFSALFKDPSFQVDTESEEYRLLNPLVSKLDKQNQKQAIKRQFEEIKEAGSDEEREEEDEVDGRPSSEEDSSDDEHTWTKEMKETHRQIQYEHRQQKRAQRQEEKMAAATAATPKFYELKAGESLKSFTGQTDDKKIKRKAKLTLGERVTAEEDTDMIQKSGSTKGNLEMTFTARQDPKESRRKQEMAEHHKERKKIRRAAGNLTSSKLDPRIFGHRRH